MPYSTLHLEASDKTHDTTGGPTPPAMPMTLLSPDFELATAA